MARLSAENTLLAKEIIGRYPLPKSALIPLLHIAQGQDGHVATDAMEHIAELVEVTPAEVIGTCSFYEMFKLEPVGKYVVNVCTNISCQLNGGEELLHHLEERLGIRPGGTTADGNFTLEDVECIAACTEAPCLQVNYRYFHRITHEEVDDLLDDLVAGRRAHEVPEHGTLARVRQHIPADRRAGPALPHESTEPPWLGGPSAPTEDTDQSTAEVVKAAEETQESSPEVQPEKSTDEVRADAEKVEAPSGDTEPASEPAAVSTDAGDETAEASDEVTEQPPTDEGAANP